MARNGHSDRVYAILQQIPPTAWERFAGRDVLRQGIVGGLTRLRSLPAHATAERLAARAVVQTAVDAFVGWSRAARQSPRELHRSLLEYAAYLFEESELTPPSAMRRSAWSPAPRRSRRSTRGCGSIRLR